MRFFTAVIYGDHRSKFGTPETSLRGERILCDRADQQLPWQARERLNRPQPIDPI